MSETSPAVGDICLRGDGAANRTRWWIHLVLIGGYFVLVGLLGYLRGQPALGHNVQGLLVTSGLNIALFALIFGLGWFASGASREEMLLHWRPGWWVVPLGVVYSLMVRFAVLIIALVMSVVLLMTVFDAEQLREFWKAAAPDVRGIVSIRAIRSNPTYAWLLITFVSFIVAGLREELWRAGTLAAMRALWPNTFGSRPGEMAAVMFLAIIFGLGHLPMGVVAAAMTTVLGVLLGLIMIIHRSIWPAVFAHGFFDATSFALLAWAPLGLHPGGPR